jgi:hypothetical protein
MVHIYGSGQLYFHSSRISVAGDGMKNNEELLAHSGSTLLNTEQE